MTYPVFNPRRIRSDLPTRTDARRWVSQYARDAKTLLVNVPCVLCERLRKGKRWM